MNPLQIMKNMMGSGMSPQNIIQQLLSNNQNPMLNNLIGMANSGNSKGVETFARNILKEQGRDFDKEFSEFRGNFK